MTSRLYAETSYARLSPRQARAVLAALLLAAAFCAAITVSPLARGNADKPRGGQGDVALYLAEVQRIHAGAGYYETADAELRGRGYPTRSVFNWRTPLPMWLIGRMPALVLGKVLLGLLAMGLIMAAFEALGRDSAVPRDFRCFNRDDLRPLSVNFRRPLACALLLLGPLLPCVLGDLFVMPVLWAGVLIALSICAYGLNRPRLGLALGLSAVFFRELALPYCLLAAVIAARTRQWREVWAWVAGLSAWLMLFALHCWQVTQLVTPAAHAHRESWIQFGGAGFVLATAQMNAFLLLLPQWVTALYFVAAMLGLAGWNSALGVRTALTVCLFVTLFAVVGQEFNQYWGCLVSPLLCLGVVRLPASLRELAHAAAGVGARD